MFRLYIVNVPFVHRVIAGLTRNPPKERDNVRVGADIIRPSSCGRVDVFTL